MKKSSYSICLLFLFFAIPAINGQAQKQKAEMQMGKNIQLVSGDSVITFNTTSKTLSRYRSDRFYCWFDNRFINCTQGYSLGKPLDGEYIITDLEGHLIQRGEFKNGLKNGSWVSWYPDGYIRSVYNWRNGKLKRNEKVYDNAGNLLKNGNQKKNSVEGQESDEKGNVWRKFKGIFKKDPEE